MTTKIENILENRRETYGEFDEVAAVAQKLKKIISRYKNENSTLSLAAEESLDMILSKIARIVCGNGKYIDSWLDIAGYAKLISDTLEDSPTELFYRAAFLDTE